MNNFNFWLRCGSFLGCSAIILGAFGSHLLKSRLNPTQMESYKIAVYYQLFHAIAIISFAHIAMTLKNSTINLANLFILLGTLFFSGSIYFLTLVKVSPLVAMLTPIGGSLLITGWACMFLSSFK
jgi:uncharacterized membrane protein YgdD (TMEM256/DUF423 family)